MRILLLVETIVKEYLLNRDKEQEQNFIVFSKEDFSEDVEKNLNNLDGLNLISCSSLKELNTYLQVRENPKIFYFRDIDKEFGEKFLINFFPMIKSLKKIEVDLDSDVDGIKILQ